MDSPHDTQGAPSHGPAATAPERPSEAVRTAVTLVLFAHLFIVGVAALGSSRAYSELVDRLVQKLVVQLRYPDLLGFRSYSYGLTYNLDSDYEAAAEVVLDWESGDESQPARLEEKDKLAVFDPAAIRLPIRRQRYLSLVRVMAELATAEPPSPREVEMPMAASRALLRESGDPEGRHRFRVLRTPTASPQYLDDPRLPTPAAVYEGNITLRDGAFEFTKADRAGLTSPVVPAESPNAPPAGGIPPIGDPPIDVPLGGPRGDDLPPGLRPFVPPAD